ncbi:hypothetical protein COCSADRAFT_200777 [Bipolaris sorokiniana ND90Pr]|uniref:Peptidase S8/S53 domain-containing protein n=1 Tax=Cochliobolus sativus (strain ND90Pr / ATCC 201652) TaxID=665912 RepID=M2T1U5_COCSN|nr:uncharacterized protein COCSADRAFT_200777 [Bipolaris sorokiniana ND90Pr]EMD63166.1 hypothetical protein COCSADRAFT_200777 [Bipolaris sorokiniana ND90Pr]
MHTAITGNNIAPLLSSDSEIVVPNKYIVVFKKDVDDPSKHYAWLQSIQPNSEDRIELRKRSGDVFTGLNHTYEMSSLWDTLIDYIERDSEDYLDANDPEIHNLVSDVPIVQRNAFWGLARISQRKSLKNKTFKDHLYAADGSAGVNVCVIDSGTNIEHVNFEGRATWLKTVLENAPDKDTGGHGMYCSDALIGKRHGIATKANFYSLKAFGGGFATYNSDIVKAIQYAGKGFRGSVVNMRLSSSGYSVGENQAIDAAIRSGLHFAVAAGNQNTDACTRSPAACDNVVTVVSSNLQERRVSSSNYGKCVDVLRRRVNKRYCLYYPTTVGALSGLPNETKNILLWNGGGSSNFTEIIGHGGYIVKKPGNVGGSRSRSTVLSV